MVARGGQAGAARAPAPGLTRQAVLDAARAELDEAGPDGVTVRGLAARLGVAVTAIYWHVGDKQTLLDALVDRVVADLGVVRARGSTPRARLRSLATSLRRTLLERPDLVAFVNRQGRTADLFGPARRALAAEMAAAGVTGEPAAMAVEAVLLVVVGSVLVDRQVERQPAQRPDPALAEGARPDEEAVFAYTLDALVGAVTSPGRGPGGSRSRPG